MGYTQAMTDDKGKLTAYSEENSIAYASWKPTEDVNCHA